MQPSFWIERWERNEIGFHQPQINPYLQAHWSALDAPSAAAVFVPMCGKSRDMQWLRKRGHLVIGAELSRVAVHDFFAALELEPQVTQQATLERWEADGYTIWCGDLFELRAADVADAGAVFDRASLIALPAEMREHYVQKMRDIVPLRAPTLLVSMTYPQSEMKGPPFSVNEAEIRRLYADHRIDTLDDIDVLPLPENARLRSRGLTQMSEQVYRLSRS